VPGEDSFGRLREDIVGCRLCPRLVAYRERVARERKREFAEESYWGRPVPGFGDPAARLVIVGLAPAAHGANRTGRVFTGDQSGAFLVEALYAAGFANQPRSMHRGDGLRYGDVYVNAAVRCVPPDNRPRPDERSACAPFLLRELRLLDQTRAILALGGFAWDATLDSVPELFGIPRPRITFAHGACAPLGPGRPLVYGSYHPSPQNTNTGRLTRAMLVSLLERIRLGYGGAHPPEPRHH
jgi:uracil-DNA glycosylase family 4